MKCSNGHENISYYNKYCPTCGERLLDTRVCKEGHRMMNTDKFCSFCGVRAE